MTTLQQLRQGLEHAWDNLAEGWQQLRGHAAQALTRFNPIHGGGELETRDEAFTRSAARWGLIAAEVSETETEIVVKLEAPGMESADFDIDVMDDVLVVRGEKRVRREQTEGRYHVMERAYGSFERAIPLPAPVEEGKARAKYRRGVLSVTLPKTGAGRRRRIEIEEA